MGTEFLVDFMKAQQRAEAAVKKAEAKALAAKEEAELVVKKPAKTAANKVHALMRSTHCNFEP